MSTPYPPYDPNQPSEPDRRRLSNEEIVAVNTGISGAAAGSSAVAGGMIIGETGGAAGAGVGSGGAASALATGAKAGVWLKIGIGVGLGALVVGGGLAGIALGNNGSGDGPGSAHLESAAPVNDSIKDYDFKNTKLVNGGGVIQLKDGKYADPTVPNGSVGMITVDGPVFADVDRDNDLDAAMLMRWVPSAGHSTTQVYVWQWDSGKARQLTYQIDMGYYGELKSLKAKKRSFTVRGTTAPDVNTARSPWETIEFGIKDDFPVQVKPVLGAVDRCPEFPNQPPLGRADDAEVLAAPDAKSPKVGGPGDFTEVVGVPSELGMGDFVLVRAKHKDGQISCGWVKSTDITQ